MFLVGLEYKLVIELYNLHSSGLLTGHYDVSILSHVDCCGHILEFEDLLHGLQSIDLVFLFVLLLGCGWCGELVNVDTR